MSSNHATGTTLAWLAAGIVNLACMPAALAQSDGLRYWVVENLDADRAEQRGTASGSGNIFSNLSLAPRTRYRIWALRAADFYIGYAEVETGRSGGRTSVPAIALTPPNLFDTDADELPDLAEFIVGTAPDRADTDGDGIDDGAEVRQGTNPVDGLPSRTGLISSTDTPGVSQDICGTSDYVAVADGAAGVTVFNIFNRMNPRAIARVPIPGTSKRLACADTRLAVVVDNDLVIVDISDPPAARVVHRVAGVALRGSASAVVVVEGLAYVGTTGGIASVDLASGTLLERITLSHPVVDVDVDGLTLIAVAGANLHTVALGNPQFRVTGTTSTGRLRFGARRLFVGGGVAYVSHAGGYNAIDVRDPSRPALIRQNDLGQFGWRDMAVNGAGVGLAATSPNSGLESANNNLSVYDVRDANATPTFETRHVTPGASRALMVSNGLAYLADHQNGLASVNYRPADTGTVAPSIVLQGVGNIDLSFSPASAEEGKLVALRAVVSDDVEVRNVEFYVNNIQVATDGNFPFEHRFTTPLLARTPTITVSARAYDTGGNSTFTAETLITLTPDATPPLVYRVSPSDGALVGRVGAIAGFFSEPLNILTQIPQNFTLVEAGPDRTLGTGDDLPVTRGTLEFRPASNGLFRTFDPPLSAGRYRATLTRGLTDAASNPLGADFTWTFQVYSTGTDTDGDGVPDEVEIALGLDPNDADSDNDGTPDGQEDADNDGLTNAAEVLLLRDPNNPDTDGDGIPDGQEDADNDGLTDAREIVLGTNPRAGDTDGDGFTDGDEVTFSSSPLDPNATPLRFAAQTFSVRAPARPGAAAQVIAIRNVDASAIPAAATQISVRNSASPDAVLRTTAGPTLTVENQAP